MPYLSCYPYINKLPEGPARMKQKTVFFWHQSEARTAATVWNWSGKTLSPGALLAVLYFSSCHIFFRPFRLFLVPTICPWVSEDEEPLSVNWGLRKANMSINLNYKSRLSLIVRVNVVLNRTVVVDSDWRFDNLCGSHLQSQSELYHLINYCEVSWLWRWLPHRLSKRQSLSTTTVLFRTTFTRTIKPNLPLKWLLGSNLSQ